MVTGKNSAPGKEGPHTVLGKLYGRAAGVLVRAYMRLVYRPRIEYAPGAPRAEQLGPVILAANHLSTLDGLLLLTAFGRSRPVTLMAKDWYDRPALRPVFRYNDCIPVNRRGLDTAWLREGNALLAAGRPFLIFPEGHTTKSGGPDTFKPGVLLLSLRSGAPVVPVWHDPYRPFHRTRIRVGPPRTLPADFAPRADALCAESAVLRDSVIALGAKEAQA